MRISDDIEQFILSNMGKSPGINISRNDLAGYFKCAPSQINYVLTTRFNVNRGFIVESKRGGGGYIKIVKLSGYDSSYVKNIIDNVIGREISYRDAAFIVEDLLSKGFLNSTQADIILDAIEDNALKNPFKIDSLLRAGILRNILIRLYNKRQKI